MDILGEGVAVDYLANDVAVVVLEGRHSVFTADSVAGAVAVALSDRQNIVFDLRDAVLVDSAQTGIVIAARRHAARSGRRVTVAAGDRHRLVRDVLRLSGAVAVIPVVETLAEAVASAESAEATAPARAAT